MQIIEMGGVGVLAPVSGGCSQYLLSATVDFRPASRPDELLILGPDRAPQQQALLDQSTLSLRIVLSSAPDGTETLQLVLTGSFATTQPLGGSPPWRAFRIKRAHLADAGGKIESISWSAMD